MSRPACDSIKACPKCASPAGYASRQFIHNGEQGYLNRTCQFCGASWEEASADTPHYEREAEAEVDLLLAKEGNTKTWSRGPFVENEL